MDQTSIDQVRNHLFAWASRVSENRPHDAPLGMFSFGSLIYRNGAQFGESSDIDLVAVINPSLNAISRVGWLSGLKEQVLDLECKLVRMLQRTATEPNVSVVAVTNIEIALDVHKDGHRNFFSENIYLNLDTQSADAGLPSAGSENCSRFSSAALSNIQKLRNKFLSQSYNGAFEGLIEYDGDDPAPKPLMRTASMVYREMQPVGDPGVEYDLQIGLDFLTDILSEASRRHPTEFGPLHSELSIRRRARGRAKPISPLKQLLLSELLFDKLVEHLDPPNTRLHSTRQTTALPVAPAPVIATESEPKKDGRSATIRQRVSSAFYEIASDTLKDLLRSGIASLGLVSESSATLPSTTANTKTPGTTRAAKDDAHSAAPPSGDVPLQMKRNGGRDKLADSEQDSSQISDSGVLRVSSTIFFMERFAKSFPGDRDVTVYLSPLEISQRLLTLLAAPLSFTNSSPIWWWRGGNMFIENFYMADGGIFIMNDVEELDVFRVASVPNKNYKRHFVYVETHGMSPTGLYPLADADGSMTHVVEEYGLYKGNKISRSKYDDGADFVDGKSVDFGREASLRARHITPYNFLIASSNSPINNPAFDAELCTTMDDLLKMDEADLSSRLVVLRERINGLPVRSEY
ncbi:MAG: hypothetical protein ACKO1J_18085 [Tagaea sp.]